MIRRCFGLHYSQRDFLVTGAEACFRAFESHLVADIKERIALHLEVYGSGLFTAWRLMARSRMLFPKCW